MNPTQTKGYVKDYNMDNGDVVVRRNDGLIIATFTADSSESWNAPCKPYKNEEAEQYGELFADAARTLNACGKTPYELYQQREELRQALKNLAFVVAKETANLVAFDGAFAIDEAIDKANEALKFTP